MKKLFFNYILYFSFLVFVSIIGISNVFAFEYTYSQVGDIYSYTEQLVSTTYASAPYNNPRNSGYAFGNVFQVDYIVSNYTFNANTNYQLESHLPNQVFTNVNAYKVSGLNGESCLTSYSNSILNNDHYPRWAFQCPHQTNTITITIYNSTNQNLWSGTSIFNWSSAVLWSSSTAMTSSDTNSIINNQKQNTQDIINNNNQNTQNIIDNQNELLGSKCNNLFNYNMTPTDNYLGNFTYTINNGIFTFNGSDSNYKFIGYNINLSKGTYYWGGIENGTGLNGISSLLSFNNNTLFCDNANCTFTLDNDTTVTFYPFRLGGSSYTANNLIVKPYISQTSQSFCEFGTYSSKLDEQNKTSKGILGKLGDLFNWLTNNDGADVSSAGNTAGWLPPGPIDSIITLPLTMLNNISLSLNKTCSPLNVNLPYVNKSVEIPCLSVIFNQITGLNSFWTWVGLISSVLILYRYLIELYKYYDRLTTLQANFISDWGSI